MHEVRGVRYGLRAELGDEPGEARHRAQRRREAVHPAVVPTEVEVRVGAATADAREHARVRVDGPRRVGLVQRARDGAVEHVLVPRRQEHRRAGTGDRPRLDRLTGLEVDRERLVVRAPDRDARVVAEEVDHLARLADGLLARPARVSPLEREVLPEQQAGGVGRVVELGPGDVRVQRSRSRLASIARSTSRASSAGVASASAIRVGPWFEPMRNSSSPLTVNFQSCTRTSRNAVRRRRWSLGAPATSTRTSTWHMRLLAEAPRPPEGGALHVDGPAERVVARGEHDVAFGLGEDRAGRVGHGREEARCERYRLRVVARIERDLE